MVELLVALTVLGTSMLILTGTLANSLRPLALAKQRSAATSAAQELIEDARSLKWTDLGLDTNDLAADPSIVSGPTGKPSFGVGCPSTTQCEEIQTSTFSANNPFMPHTTTISRGPTTIIRSVYVTAAGVDGQGAVNLKRITVRAQFARSPVGGASNVVRLSTLVALQPGGSSAGVPLSGTVDVNNGTTTITTAVGSPALPPATVMQVTNPLTKLSAIQSTRNQESCTARGPVLDLTNGSSFGPPPASTLADDDPLTAAPDTQSQSVSWAGGGVPADISLLVPQSALPAQASCLSTMLGPDAVRGGDPDLPYGSGSANGAPTTTFQTDDTAGLAGLGLVQLLSVGTATVSGSLNANPSLDSIVATAQSTTGDTRVFVINAPALPTPVLAPYGLLRIEPLTSTVTSSGSQAGTPAVPAISSGTMKIWIYDPLNLLTVAVGACTARSVAPDPVGYCIISRSVSVPLSVTQTTSLPQAGAQSLRFTVSVNATPGATSTSVTNTKSVWQAQLSPATASVRMCVTSAADCNTAAGKTVDQQVTIDLGQILAQAVKGL
ncbi:MAG: hypothetical protein NVSMB57_01210 [Actinomycetota bacterium]